MLKKAIALGAIMALPLTLVACKSSTEKADKDPVVVCDTKGYVKAGPAARVAKRTFFTCGGPECELKYKIKVGTKTRKVENDMPTPREFTVPKTAKSWNVDDCGPLFVRRAK